MTDTYTVRADHPRIWLTPERVDRYQDYRARNTLRWQRVLEQANRSLLINDVRLIENRDCMALGLVYQLTGDPKYAAACAETMQVVARSDNELKPDSFYWYRYTLMMLAAGFDWCYDRLLPEQKTQIASWLMDRSDAIWDETNGKQGYWGTGAPANNYFWGFMMTWPAALAVYGDEPRAARHIDLALNRWRTVARPFLDGWGKGGVWMESVNYDSTHRLIAVVDAHRTATGVDLLNEPGFEFIRESAYWRLHSTRPGNDGHYLLGDEPTKADGTFGDHDRWRGLATMLALKDGLERGYLKHWLNTIKPAMSDYSNAVWEFLPWDEGLEPVDYTKTEPKHYFAPGGGVLVQRSDWTDKATYWGIWAGPLAESHQNWDVNGFLIYNGGTGLVGNAGMFSNGDLKDTLWHNNYIFRDPATGTYRFQRWAKDAGQVLKHEVGDGYTYFCGQGAGAYNHSGLVCPDYCRKIVVFDNRVFVVYDRVSIVEPGLVKRLHLHSWKEPRVGSAGYAWETADGELMGDLLIPKDGVTLKYEPVRQGKDGGVTSYVTQIDIDRKQATDYVLNVLQATGDPVPVELIQSTDGKMEGALVGSNLVLFGKTERVLGAVEYEFTAERITFHTLFDLIPNSTYEVIATDLTSEEDEAFEAKSNENGTLQFQTPGDTCRISLGIPGADVTAPAIPTGLVVRADDGVAYGAWSVNQEPDLAGYYVYRANTASGPWQRQNNAPLTVQAFSQTDLPNGTEYHYRITAVDTSGNESEPSLVVSATPSAKPLTYTIGGHVTVDGTGLEGVPVQVGGITVTTISDGGFVVTNLTPGTYAVQASKPGYDFGPVQQITVGPNNYAVEITGVKMLPPEPGEFALGVNLGGVGGVIDGNQWLSASALGVTTERLAFGSYPESFALLPETDAETAKMLRTWAEHDGTEPRASCLIHTPLADGDYAVYVWMVEGFRDDVRDSTLKIEGAEVAKGLGKLPKGRWEKYGPFWAKVRDGVLDLELLRGSIGGHPLICGFAVYAVKVAEPEPAPTHAIAGTATVDDVPAPGVAINATSGAATYSTITGIDGSYVLPALPPGSYQVTATKIGVFFDPVGDRFVTLDRDLTGIDFAGRTPQPEPDRYEEGFKAGRQAALLAVLDSVQGLLGELEP